MNVQYSYAVHQYGPDAWDAEHGCLRPEVLEAIARERECQEYTRNVEELRRANEEARRNGHG